MSEIEVWLDAHGGLRRIGVLRRHASARRERVTYEHDRDWLASTDAFQFDPTLPLRPGPFAPSGGRDMFASLGDSAPDTWGRELMRRAERRSAQREGRPARPLQETDYLLGVSDLTRLGALRFRRSDDDKFLAPQTHGVPPMLALGELLAASQRVIRGEETDADLQLIFAPGSSLGGARPKASVVDANGGLMIAKFPRETDPYPVSRWEAIALDMARDCGINVVDYDLAPSPHGPVFLTRRFDRRGEARIPFVSAMAMTEHEDGDTDASYLELIDILASHGASPVEDRIELFRRIAFTILISNTDDHLRNHGFIWTGRSGWRLSPCYDLNPDSDGPRILRTRIDFDDATASIPLLRSVAEHFLRPDEGDALIRHCAGVVRRWCDYAARRGASVSEIDRLAPAFEHEDLAFATAL